MRVRSSRFQIPILEALDGLPKLPSERWSLEVCSFFGTWNLGLGPFPSAS